MQLHPNQIVDDKYDELLARLPANLANVVRQKYEKDHEEFIAAAAAVQESTEPAFWADNSCNACYGRGFSGKRYFTTNYKNEKPTPIQCKCALKRYKKWLRSYREEFNKQRETNNAKTA